MLVEQPIFSGKMGFEGFFCIHFLKPSTAEICKQNKAWEDEDVPENQPKCIV